MMNEAPTDLISIKKAMKLLFVQSRATIYNYIRNGQLSTYKIGGKTLLSESEVKGFIKKDHLKQEQQN